jgi:hypothetical protein
MEHEIADNNPVSAKNALTTIVKFNSAICAIFAAIWILATSFHDHANPLAGLSSIGLIVGLLVTISALNARLRIEWEEPDFTE